MKELTLDATIQNILVVTKFVNDELEKMNCPEETMAEIDIAIDEVFGNIASYAYSEGVGKVTVCLEVEEDNIAVITFIDSGKEYNPLEREDPNIMLSAQEREIGGLGIYIVKQSMDDVSYEYKDGNNILKIKRRMN